ncbi:MULTISPECIES: bile acid:sodium symporter family protein [Sphingomonas]|uniref:Bile acid:sodium symporter family protein n=1 Tax=Sphingomonas molluscorum TaxID=418184 RepID=A0ABU8Q2V8_9SPHN|nr:bile acid:sodium symporter family protein [Sphingomonas sp. JUb134]MBM7405347.1 sodium/bile acid cotransporter 7 [Sphingomonas sp. JUb134]
MTSLPRPPLFRRLTASIDGYSMLLIATVVVATLLPCRGRVAEGFALLTQAAIALLFFLHGAKLSRAAIVAGLTAWRLHLVVFAATFLMFPLLGLGVEWSSSWFLSPALAQGLLFLTLLPSTVQSSIAFTAIARGNVPAAVCSASLSNIAGIFITPVLVALLMGVSASGGDSLAAIEEIALQLLLPFIVGHLARPLVGGFIERHKPLVSTVDRGSILLVVYTAFSAAVIEGLWHRVPAWQLVLVTIVCCLLLAVVLFATRTLARRLGFSRADEIAIVFCGSKKSLASGVPMAGVLFPAAQVGALILPLMIFHQLQLLACAVIARRYAEADLPADA